jgi:hypothetical protein
VRSLHELRGVSLTETRERVGDNNERSLGDAAEDAVGSIHSWLGGSSGAVGVTVLAENIVASSSSTKFNQRKDSYV